MATPLRADVVIDNFSCPDSLTQTGFGGTSTSITCAGSIGGFRSDVIFVNGGTGTTSVSTLDSNPPPGALTGTIGPNLVGQDVFLWMGSPTAGDWDLPDLNLTGDAIRIGIESTSGGTLDVSIGSGPHPDAMTSRFDFVETFSASAGFQDVVIPLSGPVVTGTGADLSAVTVIGLHVEIPGGSTYTMDSVTAVPTAVPEPSAMTLLSTGLVGLLATRLIRNRAVRR
jgi:hypothetical protein